MSHAWVTVPMGELCSIQSGKSDTKDAVLDGPYAFFDRSKTIKRSNRFIRDCEALIVPGEGTEFLPRHFRGKFDLHQRAYALFDFSPRVEVRFLYYYLHHVSEYFPRVAVGATVKSLRLRHFEQLPVRLVDIEQQRRIVAILDEAFEGIATAKAHAERNLRNAREVQDGYLANLFSSTQNWTMGPLSSFVESISTGPFGSMLHKSDYVDDGVPLVNPINIVGGSIVPTKEKQVDEATAVRLRSYLLRSGDIVVGRRGEIGRCAVVSDTQYGWLCGTGCFFIRPTSDVEPSFMAHLIRSAPYRTRLEALSTGTTMQNLSNGALSGLEVSLPSLAEQKRLLAAIDAVSFHTDQMNEIGKRKLAALDELKRTLLHQAFSGQL